MTSSLSDDDFAARVASVQEKIQDILKEEGGELHTVLKTAGQFVFSTTEQGRERIVALEYIKDLHENGPAFDGPRP